MAEKLGLDNEVHELKIGNSFGGGPVAYHSIRYDFKPASVDTTQVANVDIGEGNSVTVTVPHVEGSVTSHTVYKGNKKPCQKECLLIIDHQTGEITLEKLATNIQLKKTRMEGTSKAQLHGQRPLTPTDKAKDLKSSTGSSPKKKKATAPPSASQTNQPAQPAAPTHQVAALKVKDTEKGVTSPCSVGTMSSSSDSDSDSDMDISSPTAEVRPSSQSAPPSQHVHKSFHSTLSQDLQLSDSGSDSDS